MDQTVMAIDDSVEQPLPTKDRRFQSFRVPRSDAARALVADIINQIQNYERHFGLRKRARREADQEIFEATIAAVVCDAIHRFCEDPDGKIAVTRSHTVLGRKSRYRAASLGTTLPTLLDRLSAPEMDFIRMEMGSRWEEMVEGAIMQTVGRQTTIQAAPSLIRRIKDNDLWFTDLDTSESEEIIILKAEKARGESGDWLEYEDTPDTLHYRSELRSINEWLSQADIEFDQMSASDIDPNARRLRRVFNNGSFTQGGRLYGGFWMNLKKEVRRKDISIEGEAVVELDYGQMALRQLYARAGAKPAKGDLYEVPGVPWRQGVKTVINAALYSTKQQLRMPQGARKHIPENVSFKKVFDVIADYHAPITRYFFTGIGMELMFEESEIMIQVLHRARERGKVALPIHDSVLTAQSSAPLIKKIMEDVFKERTGLHAIVGVETG